MMKVALAFALIVGAGCSSRPTEPDGDQEWLTLAEYRARSGLRKNPVVTVPAGVGVELRISRKAVPLIEDMDEFFFDAFEPVDDQMVVVRLKARTQVHLDLEHLLASIDKKSWMSLGWYFFPLLRRSHVRVLEGGGLGVEIPVTTSLDQVFLGRDYLGEGHPR